MRESTSLLFSSWVEVFWICPPTKRLCETGSASPSMSWKCPSTRPAVRNRQPLASYSTNSALAMLGHIDHAHSTDAAADLDLLLTNPLIVASPGRWLGRKIYGLPRNTKRPLLF